MELPEKLYFLRSHPMKTEENQYHSHWQFHFSYSGDSVESYGIIDIPKDEKGKLRWIYRELDYKDTIVNVKHFKQSASNDYTDLPEGWFKDSLLEVRDYIHKRNRIRSIFQGRK